MLSHRSSGKIGTAGVKHQSVQKDQQMIQEEERQKAEPIEETVFRPPKEKRKKLKFQRDK